jgi:hypothetical protein
MLLLPEGSYTAFPWQFITTVHSTPFTGKKAICVRTPWLAAPTRANGTTLSLILTMIFQVRCGFKTDTVRFH